MTREPPGDAILATSGHAERAAGLQDGWKPLAAGPEEIFSVVVDTKGKWVYTSSMETLSQQLRGAILRDARSLRAIGEAAGTDHGILSRFLRSKRSLTLPTAENVCKALGLVVYLVPRGKGKRWRP